MSALPHSVQTVGEAEARDRARDLLSAATRAVLAVAPELGGFIDHREGRDRPAGVPGHGVEPLCHVSPLSASLGAPAGDVGTPTRLLAAADTGARGLGLTVRSREQCQEIWTMTWSGPDGEMLEAVVGVKMTLRSFSAPFLPAAAPGAQLRFTSSRILR